MADADAPDIGVGPSTATPPPPPPADSGTSSPPPTTGSNPPAPPSDAMIAASHPAAKAETQAWQTAQGIAPATPSAAPVVLQPLRRHGMQGVIDEVGKFLTGTQGGEVYIDQDGNKFIQHPPMTHAQQWARVGAAALQGAGRGLAAGQGPGGHARAFAASVQGGINDRQQADALKDEEATKTWQMQRQAKIDKATMQIQQMKIAEMSLAHDRQGFEFTAEKEKFADEQQDRYKAMGGHPLPGFYTSDDWHTLKDVAPNVLKMHAQNANIMPVHTAQGVQFWEVPPDRLDAPLPAGTTGRQWVQDDSKEGGHTVNVPMAEGSTERDLEMVNNKWTLDSGAALARREQIAKTTTAEEQARVAGRIADLDVKTKNATLGNIQAETNLRNAEAEEKRAGAKIEATPDATGFKPDVEGMGGIKEYNKKLNAFKRNFDGLAATEAATYQFQDTLNNLSQGKPMTGAESVTGLFNAIGLSVAPVKGMGGSVRITKNMIEQHEQARGWLDDLRQKLLEAKEGDVITPDQIRGYARIALNSRRTLFVNTVNEMHNMGLSADAALPVGNGKALDHNTAQIFFDVSGGDPKKAQAAAEAKGWQVPQVSQVTK